MGRSSILQPSTSVDKQARVGRLEEFNKTLREDLK